MTLVKMGAGFTILTHFSQRYSKSPLLDEIEREGGDNPKVGVAWDNMTVSPLTWGTIPLAYPLMKLVFAKEFEDMEERRKDYIEKNAVQNLNEEWRMVTKMKKRRYSDLEHEADKEHFISKK